MYLLKAAVCKAWTGTWPFRVNAGGIDNTLKHLSIVGLAAKAPVLAPSFVYEIVRCLLSAAALLGYHNYCTRYFRRRVYFTTWVARLRP